MGKNIIYRQAPMLPVPQPTLHEENSGLHTMKWVGMDWLARSGQLSDEVREFPTTSELVFTQIVICSMR